MPIKIANGCGGKGIQSCSPKRPYLRSTVVYCEAQLCATLLILLSSVKLHLRTSLVWISILPQTHMEILGKLHPHNLSSDTASTHHKTSLSYSVVVATIILTMHVKFWKKTNKCYGEGHDTSSIPKKKNKLHTCRCVCGHSNTPRITREKSRRLKT